MRTVSGQRGKEATAPFSKSSMVAEVVARRRATASRGNRVAARMLRKIWPILTSRPATSEPPEPLGNRDDTAGARERGGTSAAGSLIRMIRRNYSHWSLADRWPPKNTHVRHQRGKSPDLD